MEFEQNWSFPIFEIILLTSILAIHNTVSTRINSYVESYGLIYFILITAAVFSRSFAKSMERREIYTLLSYPIKRWEIFLAKFVTNFLITFGVLAFTVYLNIFLLNLQVFDITVHTLIVILFIQLLYMCAISATVSVIAKNETLSVFIIIFLMFGIEYTLAQMQVPYQYFTLYKGNYVMLAYITFLLSPPPSLPFKPLKPPFTFEEFLTALGYPLLVCVILLAALFVYFQWIMQLD